MRSLIRRILLEHTNRSDEPKSYPYSRFWKKYGVDIGENFKSMFGFDYGLPDDVYHEIVKYYGGTDNYEKELNKYLENKIFEVRPAGNFGGYNFDYKIKIEEHEITNRTTYVDKELKIPRNTVSTLTPDITKIQILPGGSVVFITDNTEMELENAVKDGKIGWEIISEIKEIVDEQQGNDGMYSKFGVYPFNKRIEFI